MLTFLAFSLVIQTAPTATAPVKQTKNGEFIFSQYPPRALAAKEQGSVRFRAEVDDKGNPLQCEVTASSGFRRLDKETCDLIVDHATFKPTLDSSGRARSAVHDGIVNWRIPGQPDPMPVSIKVASDDGNQKLICKRSLKTGSLIVHTRLCLTQNQWNKVSDDTQDDWGSLQGRKGSTNGVPATIDGN